MTSAEQFTRGHEVYERAIQRAMVNEQTALHRFVDWEHETVTRQGFGECWSMTGKAARWELQVRLPRLDASLVKAWIEGGKASLQFHDSVWARYSPRCRSLMERLGVPFNGGSYWFEILDWSERELAVIALAYREVSLPTNEFDLLYERLERDLPVMATIRAEDPDVVAEGRVVLLEELNGDRFVCVYGEAPHAPEAKLNPASPLGRAVRGARVNDIVTYEAPDGTLRVRVVEVRT